MATGAYYVARHAPLPGPPQQITQPAPHARANAAPGLVLRLDRELKSVEAISQPPSEAKAAPGR